MGYATRLHSSCLNAMLEHHRMHRDGAYNDDASSPTSLLSDQHARRQQDPLAGYIDLPACEIAKRFAHEASHSLSSEELRYLQHFFLTPPKVPVHSATAAATQKALDEHIDEFYTTETKISDEGIESLARSSGPADAELGVILHQLTKEQDDVVLQTADSKPYSVWDDEQPTIGILSAKGFRPQTDFFMDWHWRSEASMRGRGSCSARMWRPSLKSLHDTMSSSILDMLNFRFVLICGDCAKKSYQNRRAQAGYHRTLWVPLQTGQHLEFRLEFNRHFLRRIVAFAVHPSAIYLSNKADVGTVPCTLEAAANLFLWLLARPHNPTSVQNNFREKDFRPPRAAPFASMRRYIDCSKTSRRVFREDEYEQPFLSWAQKTLKEEYHRVVQTQSSIAGACGAEMDRRALKGREAKHNGKRQDGIGISFRECRSQSNRELNHKRYSISVREF